MGDSNKDLIKEWARVNIVGKTYDSIIGVIHITTKEIKEALNQPHMDYHGKNNAVYYLPNY